MNIRTIFFILVLFNLLNAQVEKAYLKPYIFFPYENDSPKNFNYGAFHYTNVHNTLPSDSVGKYYQSGLFHTWYRPDKIYGREDYSRDKYGYHCMEGGVGYKPYLRFHSKITPQKFTTGAVAGGFGAFSNGPGQGSPSFKRSMHKESLGWEDNLGRYGAAHISNSMLFPMDGLNLEEGTNNKMLGYGYYALPLTEPKAKTAGLDIPTGNHCWTLFLNTKNFSGPVCFFTPYHWSKYSLKNDTSISRGFDNSLLKVNSGFQRETNKIPAKQWKDENGDTYYRITPLAMPSGEDIIGNYGTMPMTFSSQLWDDLEKWFKHGGEPVTPGFKNKDYHVRTSNGVKLSFTLSDHKISTSSFAKTTTGKKNSSASIKWTGPLVEKLKSDLVKMPEFYVLKKGAKTAIAIAAKEVPKTSGLHQIKFPEAAKEDYDFSDFISEDLATPLHPDYKFSNEITKAWATPGPALGPFVTTLNGNSKVIYYWYKFNEQPAILNSDMGDKERELIQKRIELLHKHWKKDDKYFPAPEHPLASLDNGVIVTPPKGLEYGYVPIVVHQQKADKPLAKYKKINRIKEIQKNAVKLPASSQVTPSHTAPKQAETTTPILAASAKKNKNTLQVYILAGQSNMVGQGVVKGKDTPGTLEYCIANDRSKKYAFLNFKQGKVAEQKDVWIYYETKGGKTLSGNLTTGYTDNPDFVGLELSFGEEIQQHHNQQILLIKTAWGGKSLGKDFRPPSAGGETGPYYKKIVSITQKVLKDLDQHFPGYDKSKGYEIAGLCWHQGWNDHVSKPFTAEYTTNLAHLINDLRKDLKSNFPVVIATTGMPMKKDAISGKKYNIKPISKAQLAIADHKKYPKFKGNVTVVDTRPFWKSIKQSPAPGGGQHYHWNKSAEIYLDIGFGCAEAFIELTK